MISMLFYFWLLTVVSALASYLGACSYLIAITYRLCFWLKLFDFSIRQNLILA